MKSMARKPALWRVRSYFCPGFPSPATIIDIGCVDCPSFLFAVRFNKSNMLGKKQPTSYPKHKSRKSFILYNIYNLFTSKN
jgi:hypothetical protein